VVLATLCFGALHVDPVHAAFAAVLGLYLGILSHLAGSVLAAIAGHAVNNLCAVVMSAFFPGFEIPPAASIGLGGGFALAALAWVWRSVGGPPSLEDSRRGGSDGATQLGPTGGSRIGRL
jgi:membrane protease YdiL (CAAX protease family)